MLKINLSEENDNLSSETNKLLEEIYQALIEKEGLGQEAEVSLLLTNNEEIQELNRDYRNLDQATDVLSFPIYEREEIEALLKDQEGPELILLGDIIISMERAGEQAHEYGHSLKREVAYLFVHGLLHLLGYDHLEEDEKKEMRTREEEILKSFSLAR